MPLLGGSPVSHFSLRETPSKQAQSYESKHNIYDDKQSVTIREFGDEALDKGPKERTT